MGNPVNGEIAAFMGYQTANVPSMHGAFGSHLTGAGSSIINLWHILYKFNRSSYNSTDQSVL